MKEKVYRIYGLSIKSEMEFSEVPEIALEKEEKADVRIRCGSIPEHAQKAIQEGKIGIYFRKEAWFLVRGVGKYYISNGNEIIAERLEGADAHKIKSFVLGASLGVLLLQREILALHGSGVVVNNHAWIITGKSGAGKSTLTTKIIKENGAFLADDTVALKKEDEVWAIPGYPQQKLCKDAVVKLGFDTERLQKIDENREKYAVSLTNHFYNDKIKLGLICELTLYEGDKVLIEEVQGHEKLQAFLDNIYCGITIRQSGMSPELFMKCVQIVQQIPWYRIRRPKNGDTTKEQFDLLKAVYGKKK